jgi:predicted nucleic acid-binding protein
MLTIENTQARIKNIVKAYKADFPNEYEAVCRQIDLKRKMNDNEFAAVIGEHAIRRRIYEIPEKLSTALYKVLDPEENQWLITKKGAAWFAGAFPEFKSSYKI